MVNYPGRNNFIRNPKKLFTNEAYTSNILMKRPMVGIETKQETNKSLSIMTNFTTIRRRADIAVVAPMPRNATVAMRTERDERPVEDT